MIVKTDARFEAKFASYSAEVENKLQNLRRIINDAAKESSEIIEIEETTKWGEPSFLVQKGSTVRIDWKKKQPEQYAIYFKCTSKLVSTFRQLYPDDFNFVDNRAIVFKMDDPIPEVKLKHCISLALNYHSVKHLELLGA